MQTFVELFKAW